MLCHSKKQARRTQRFGERKNMRTITIVAVIIIVASLTGCATSGSKKFEGMSLDAFIDSLPGKEQSNPQSKWAYRIKALKSDAEYAAQASFENWCKAQGGSIATIANKDVIPIWKSFATFSKHGFNNSHRVGVCIDKNIATIAAWATFSDAGLAFYTNAQAPALQKEAERIEALIITMREERYKRDKVASERRFACLTEKAQEIRNNLRPGIHTTYGMGVEITQPLAQLQAPGPNGPTLQWVEIGRLSPPSDVCGL